MSPEFIIIALLLLLNACFSLSEMAIVSASKPLLRQLGKQGNKSALIALDLSENSGRFLSTVQVGITLVGTLAGAYGGATIAEKLKEPFNQIAIIAPHGDKVAVFVVVSLLTYFSVVIGELFPKQLALNNPEKFALLVARPMSILSKACTPIVLLLESSAKAMLFILRIKPNEEGVTETEIKAIIAEGVMSGAIEGEEHDVIRRVIRLGDRDISSVMTHRTGVSFIDIDDDFATVQRKISLAGHSRYPVIDKDTTKILGIVKTKKIMAWMDGDPQIKNKADFNVRHCLSEIAFLNENTSCLDALSVFKTQRLQIAAIVDEYGSFEGLFTMADLMEAIVGTIPSNYDHDEGPLITRRENGSWLVDGLTPIDEIHVTIGLDDIKNDADYQTIAGFVLEQLKERPAVGKHFIFGNHRFEIMDMDKHRIDKILIEKSKSIMDAS
jgi:putative hemolysin